MRLILATLIISTFSSGIYANDSSIEEKFIINATQPYPYSDKVFYNSASNSHTVLESMPSSAGDTTSLAVKAPTNQSYNKFFQSTPKKASYNIPNIPNIPENQIPTVEYALDKNLARISD